MSGYHRISNMHGASLPCLCLCSHLLLATFLESLYLPFELVLVAASNGELVQQHLKPNDSLKVYFEVIAALREPFNVTVHFSNTSMTRSSFTLGS